ELLTYIINGGRESFNIFNNFSILEPNYVNNKVIRDEFKDLIQLAWKNCPDERILLSTLYLRLSKLSSIAHSSETADSCVISDLISHKSSQDNFRQGINQILTIEEGISLHRSKKPENRKKAWKCFEDNIKLKSSIAIFWKAYYLWEGLYPTGVERSEEQKEREQSEARELFKKAADEGVTDAQFRYASSLPNTRDYTAKRQKLEM
ncbi:3933_t:CDS:2, partial [Dentiscutata heterogama]